MAKPEDKAPAIDALLNSMTGGNRVDQIKKNLCVPKPIGCAGNADKFTDAKSAREYTISGLCQECQDKFFGN